MNEDRKEARIFGGIRKPQNLTRFCGLELMSGAT